MKKLLKVLGVILAIVAFLALCGFFYINSKGIPSYEVQKVEFTHVSSPEILDRGKKFANIMCASCHLDSETGALTGHLMTDMEKEFGTIYSPNITQDKKYGIGDWTDGELLYLLRTGIKKDGTYAPPYMSKWPHMADDDINAIIAFLRSDDPLVAPNPAPDTPSQPSFLVKLLCQLVFKPLEMPDKRIPMPDTSNQVELGEYLAINLDCYSCHSENFKTVNIMEPEKSKGFFAGGNPILNLEGQVFLSSNLTPDKETGIGNWTEEQFVRAVKYGLIDGEAALRYPMIPFVQLTDQEAAAIYAYLMTLPAIEHDVKRSHLDLADAG